MKKEALIGTILGIVFVLGIGIFLIISNPEKKLVEQSGNERVIEIREFSFTPKTLTINKGEIVAWTNYDSTTHTITSDSGSELNGEPLSQGQKYLHTFNSLGTFTYHCNFHQSMKGTIIVQ